MRKCLRPYLRYCNPDLIHALELPDWKDRDDTSEYLWCGFRKCYNLISGILCLHSYEYVVFSTWFSRTMTLPPTELDQRPHFSVGHFKTSQPVFVSESECSRYRKIFGARNCRRDDLHRSQNIRFHQKPVSVRIFSSLFHFDSGRHRTESQARSYLFLLSELSSEYHSVGSLYPN